MVERDGSVRSSQTINNRGIINWERYVQPNRYTGDKILIGERSSAPRLGEELATGRYLFAEGETSGGHQQGRDSRKTDQGSRAKVHA